MNVSKVLEEIRVRVDRENLIHSCSGEGCTISMTDIPAARIVVHVEREFDARSPNEKRCDRLLFYVNATKKLVAVPIELKRGKARESEVIEKLENSLKFAANLVPTPITLKTVYVPLLFHGRGINWTNPKRRKQLSLSFRGRNLQVLIGHCGKARNLAQVLGNAGCL